MKFLWFLNLRWTQLKNQSDIVKQGMCSKFSNEWNIDLRGDNNSFCNCLRVKVFSDSSNGIVPIVVLAAGFLCTNESSITYPTWITKFKKYSFQVKKLQCIFTMTMLLLAMMTLVCFYIILPYLNPLKSIFMGSYASCLFAVGKIISMYLSCHCQKQFEKVMWDTRFTMAIYPCIVIVSEKFTIWSKHGMIMWQIQ